MNVYKPEYKIPLPEKYKIGDANPNNGVWKRGLGPDKESKSANPVGTKSEGRRQVTWKEAGKKRTGILSQDGDGVLLPCERYRCEFTDNGEIRRRLTLFSNERKSMEASEKIKDILSSAGILGGNLGGWFEHPGLRIMHREQEMVWANFDGTMVGESLGSFTPKAGRVKDIFGGTEFTDVGEMLKVVLASG